MNPYKHDSEIFDLKARHDIEEEIEEGYANKNYFNSQIVKIFKFIVAIISIIATVVTIYAICKHKKLRALVTSLAFQQAKEVRAEKIIEENHSCECTAQFYKILALSIIIIGLVVFVILQVRRIKLCRGQLFPNVVKIMFFISDVQYYKVRLNKHFIWGILEINWSEVKVTFKGKVINLPKSIPVKIWDKFKVSQYLFI